MTPPTAPSLFGPPRNRQTSAGMRPQAYPWHAYALGYRLGADAILTKWNSNQGREFLSYPLVFACRHYLELRLKDIITCARELFTRPARSFKSHELTQLWNETRALSERASPGEDPAFYEPIEQCIQQFHHEDPGSFSFRYPFDTSGQPLLPNLGDFDLESFAAQFTTAADNLDAIADYFHEATQAERQALADLR